MEKLILPFEVKNIDSKSDEKYYIVEGYASTFGNIDRGGDIIIRGAFSEALREQANFPLLWQHDQRDPIGAFTGAEDVKGLFIKAKLPKNTIIKEKVIDQLEVGSVKAFSIGYSTQDVDFTEEGNRVLKKVKLWETSLVTIPMNEEALITGFKSFVSSIEKVEISIEDAKELKDVETFLKSKGLSKNECRSTIYKVNSIKEKDADDEKEQKRCDAVEEQKRCDAVEKQKQDVSDLKEIKNLLSNYLNK